jgi:hypothetical protein
MIRRRLPVIASLLITIVVVVPEAAVGKKGGTDRPLKATGTGVTTADLATATGTSDGTARVSRLGRASYHLDVTFTITGPTTFGLVGTGTLVAANGDSVFSTLTGTATATGIGVGETAEQTVVFTITGGTGRFADARGTLTAAVTTETVSIAGTALTNRDTFRARGSISY